MRINFSSLSTRALILTTVFTIALVGSIGSNRSPGGFEKKTIRIKSALNLRRSKAGIKKKPDK